MSFFGTMHAADSAGTPNPTAKSKLRGLGNRIEADVIFPFVDQALSRICRFFCEAWGAIMRRLAALCLLSLALQSTAALSQDGVCDATTLSLLKTYYTRALWPSRA